MSFTISHKAIVVVVLITLIATGGGVYSGYIYSKMQSKVEYQEEINELKGQVSREYEIEIAGLQYQISSLNKTNIALENQFSEVQTDVTELQTQLEERQSENTLLMNQVSSLENEINLLNEKLSSVPPLSETIKIGYIMPSSSSYERGVSWIEEVVEPELNEYVALLGYDVTFDILCEHAHSQAAVHLEKVQAFHAMGVDLIHGGGWSSMAQAALSYVNENNMLLFSSSSTSPVLRIANDNLYRLSPDDTIQAPAICDALDSYGIKGIVFIQRADSWADGIYNQMLTILEELDIEVGDRIRYAGEVTEFSSYLATADKKIGELIDKYGANHVAIELIAFGEATTMVTQAADFPNLWSVMWFGSDGTAMSATIRDEAPDQAVHLKILSTYAAPPRTEKFQILNDKHMEMFNTPLGFYTAAGYDVFWAIARAVLEAQSTDPSDVIPLLPSICSDMFGVSGWCTLNEAGDRAKADYDIWGYGWHNGRCVIVRYGRYDGTSGQVIWHDPAYTDRGKEVPGLILPK